MLDAGYDYLRYREGVKADPSETFKLKERRLLLARGRLEVPPQEVVTRPNVDAPERGHATARLSVGAGFSGQAGAFETLAIRGAIHDYLIPTRGYPADARLEMGDLRLRFQNRDRAVRLDRLDAVDIVSAAPLDRWVRGVSWKVWIGADNARELGCERAGATNAGWRCLLRRGHYRRGRGDQVRPAPQLPSCWRSPRPISAPVRPSSDAHNFRLGGGGEAMLAGGAGDGWRFELGARYAYYFLGQRGQNLRARVAQAVMLGHRLALRAAVETAMMHGQVVGGGDGVPSDRGCATTRRCWRPRAPAPRGLRCRRTPLEAAEADAGLGHLLDQERGAALRAGLGQRAVPGDEVALGLRVVRAAEEDLARAAALLGEVAAAVAGQATPRRSGLVVLHSG